MEVIVYSQPNCVQCNATYRALDKHGVEYTVVDLTKEADRLEELKELGFAQAPVVFAGAERWSGFRPDKIKAVVDSMAMVALRTS